MGDERTTDGAVDVPCADGGHRRDLGDWPPKFDGWHSAAKPPDHDETYTRTYKWTFQSQQFEWELAIPVSTYAYCSDRHRTHTYGVYLTDPFQESFVEDLVTRFERFGDRKGLDEASLLTAVARFVQSISYSLDVDNTGHLTYPKYAIETLVHGRGDCEDGTILLGTLLYNLGYNIAALMLPNANHMLLGVNVDWDAGSYFECNGTHYYPIETTGTGWSLGEIPPSYRNESAKIHRPNDHPVLVHEWEAVPEASGTAEVTARVANFSTVEADSVDVQIEFERRDGKTVERRRLNTRPESLNPGQSRRYQRNVELPTSRTLRGRLIVAISNVIHDISESEWN